MKINRNKNVFIPRFTPNYLNYGNKKTGHWVRFFINAEEEISGGVEFHRVGQGSGLADLNFRKGIADDLLGNTCTFATLAGHVGGGADFLVATASFIDRIANLSVGNTNTKTHIHKKKTIWVAGSMTRSLMLMRMLVKALDEGGVVERPTVGISV